MFKKIIFTYLIFLCVFSFGILSYRIFEPRDTVTQSDTSNYLAYESLEAYIKQGSQNVHYLFFYSRTDSNCIYVHETLFPLVENDIGISMNSIIETVDITEVDETLETTQLFETWSISSYPSFAAIRVKDGEIQIINKLEWTASSSLTLQSIEEWLLENNLYTPK